MNEVQLEALKKARVILGEHFGAWIIALEWRVEDEKGNWRMGYHSTWGGSAAQALGLLNLAEGHVKAPYPRAES